jgi:CubicO group peptidase (beta-lactamase class C family)
VGRTDLARGGDVIEKRHRTRCIEGSLHPDFTPVAQVFRDIIRQYPGGGAVSVYHRGHCVVDLWGGWRDRADSPWLPDTMAPSFSTTKGVAATLLHILADRGLLDYDDKVATYWPEFAQAGKASITVRHVLAHQSGLYHIRRMIDRADRMLDWGFMIHAIERTAPIHPPGTRTGYHGLTFGFLVGEILQRVTGKSFSDLVQQELVIPLQLDGMYVGAPDAALARAARLMWMPQAVDGLKLLSPDAGPVGKAVLGGSVVIEWLLRRVGLQVDLESVLDALAPRGIGAFDFGAERTLRVAIPAANGLFTARSLAKMYAALAGGGQIDGVRLMSSRTLARATQVQNPTPDRVVIPFDLRWRLGYHGISTTRGAPRSAFGHFGFGGSGGWADPRRQLAVALVVNGGMGTPFGDWRIARISGAALASAGRRHTEQAAAATSYTRRAGLHVRLLDALSLY